MVVNVTLPVDGLGRLGGLLRADVLLNDLRRSFGADLGVVGLAGSLEKIFDALGDVGHVGLFGVDDCVSRCGCGLCGQTSPAAVLSIYLDPPPLFHYVTVMRSSSALEHNGRSHEQNKQKPALSSFMLSLEAGT